MRIVIPITIVIKEEMVVRITILADKDALLFIALAIINDTEAVGAANKTKIMPK